jgi:transcriptional regulator with XRE-family HTH domain
MDARGYSLKLVEAIRGGDPSDPVIRLGKYCIDNQVPVSDLAKYFGVSRLTVYNWMFGRMKPRKSRLQQLQDTLERLGV